MIDFISIDPSLRNTGIVYGVINEDFSITPKEFKLFTTKKDSTKKVRASSDLIRRVKYLHTNIIDTITKYSPQVIFAETPSGSKSSNAMKSYGISCALIAIIEPAPIQVTPQEVKKQVLGKISGTKEEIISYVSEKYPDFNLPKAKTRAEHIADAVCIAESGITTNQFEQIKKFIK